MSFCCITEKEFGKMGLWEQLVMDQIFALKESGLYDRTDKLFVSWIYDRISDIETVVNIIGKDKCEIISSTNDKRKYEYSALDFIYKQSKKEDFLVCYFHTGCLIKKKRL